MLNVNPTIVVDAILYFGIYLRTSSKKFESLRHPPDLNANLPQWANIIFRKHFLCIVRIKWIWEVVIDEAHKVVIGQVIASPILTAFVNR